MKIRRFPLRLPSLAAAIATCASLFLAPSRAGATDALPSDLMNIDYHLTARPWTPLSTPSSAYLDRVEGICRYFKTTQNSSGAIIDPYLNADEGGTPTYAYAVAVLVSQGRATDLLSSGTHAMNYAVGQMSTLSSGGTGIEFSLPVLSEALQVYQPLVSTTQYNSWKSTISGNFSPNSTKTNNWRAYWMDGQWDRAIYGMISTSTAKTDIDNNWNSSQSARIAGKRWSLYEDTTSNPDTLAVEVAGSLNFLDLDYHGYSGTTASAIKTAAETATKTLLVMQDPSGQAPCGGRTDNHCWIDSGYQLSYELMAQIQKTAGNTWQAGQYQHAAELNFNNLSRWLRTDPTFNGSFYVTKNKFDPSQKVGYQSESTYSAYGCQMSQFTAAAFMIRNSTGAIAENPAPCEIGGYAFALDSDFSAAFANAGGMAMKADLRGDTASSNGNFWTSAGVTRFGRPGWDTRLGPSDGRYNGSVGVSFAPTYNSTGSTWVRVASMPNKYTGTFTTTMAHPLLTKCQIVWSGSGVPTFTQAFTITPDGILCQTTQSGAPGAWGVTYPLLTNDGTTALTNTTSGTIASVSYPSGNGDQQNFIMLNNAGAALTTNDAVTSSYGTLTAVQAVTTDGTNNTFIYPRVTSDPSAASVRSGFSITASGFTSPLGKVNGTTYVGRTSAGGVGNALDIDGNGTNDVTFSGTCGFIIQLNNGVATAVEADRVVSGTIQGHPVTLAAYTPFTISGTGGSAPPAPTGLSATPGDSQAGLSWAASSGATGYNVKRSTTSGGPYSTISSPTGTSYTDTGLTNGTTYYYVVSATNTFGESANSTQASATPTGGGGGGTLSLNSWTLDAGTIGSNLNTNGPTLGNGTAGSTENEAMSAPFTAATLTNIGDAITVTGTAVITLSSITVDQFRLGLFNHNGQSSFTGWLGYVGSNSQGASAGTLRERTNPNTGAYYSSTGASTLNTALAGGSANLVSGTYALSFTVTKTASNAIQVAYAFSNGGSYVLSDSFTDTGNANTTFTYDRVGILSGGSLNGSSIVFSNMQVTTPGGAGSPPAAPTGLTATPGNAQVGLSWTASSGATSYNVKRSTTSGGPYTTVNSPTGTSYTDTGLTNGTTYYYVVSAVNGSGEGPNSSQVSGTPNGTPPPVPTGVVATPGDTQVSLSWTASSGATSYNVKRSLTSGGPYTTVNSPTGTTYTDTGLTDGTVYYYVVSAVNGSGESANSSEVNAEPAAAGGLPSPWVDQDIGTVGTAGSATYTSGTFTLSGAGTVIGGTADSFHFVYQPVTGDCTITAREISQSGYHHALDGVMIRDSLAANAEYVDTVIKPSTAGYYYGTRTTTGGSGSAIFSTAGTAPEWLRVQRVGTTFTSSISSDGVTWTTINTATVTMGSTVYVGLVQCDGDGNLGTSTYDNVTVGP